MRQPVVSSGLTVSSEAGEGAEDVAHMSLRSVELAPHLIELGAHLGHLGLRQVVPELAHVLDEIDEPGGGRGLGVGVGVGLGEGVGEGEGEGGG
jgi:hypothetical protein